MYIRVGTMSMTRTTGVVATELLSTNVDDGPTRVEAVDLFSVSRTHVKNLA